MKLNKRQKIVLWIGIIIVVLMGLFPPWKYTFSVRFYGIDSEQPAKYYFIGCLPKPKIESKAAGIEIDTSRLLIQWVIVATLTSGLLITLKANPKP